MASQKGKAMAITSKASIDDEAYIPHAMQIIKSAHVLSEYVKYLRSPDMKGKTVTAYSGMWEKEVGVILRLPQIDVSQREVFDKLDAKFPLLQRLEPYYRPANIFSAISPNANPVSPPTARAAWSQCVRELGLMLDSLDKIKAVPTNYNLVGKIIEHRRSLTDEQQEALREIWQAAKLIAGSDQITGETSCRLALQCLGSLEKGNMCSPSDRH